QDETYYLPDVMVTCDARDHADRHIKRYPSLVAEVVSPGSVQRDRVEKFRKYLELPSLKYYLLINQDQISVEVYARGEQGVWQYQHLSNLDDLMQLKQLNISASLADMYEDVDLHQTEA
ncbi:MAG: Uma2 family endonuclease, partial [Bacteroidota bacterium]